MSQAALMVTRENADESLSHSRAPLNLNSPALSPCCMLFLLLNDKFLRTLDHSPANDIYILLSCK